MVSSHLSTHRFYSIYFGQHYFFIKPLDGFVQQTFNIIVLVTYFYIFPSLIIPFSYYFPGEGKERWVSSSVFNKKKENVIFRFLVIFHPMDSTNQTLHFLYFYIQIIPVLMWIQFHRGFIFRIILHHTDDVNFFFNFVYLKILTIMHLILILLTLILWSHDFINMNYLLNFNLAIESSKCYLPFLLMNAKEINVCLSSPCSTPCNNPRKFSAVNRFSIHRTHGFISYIQIHAYTCWYTYISYVHII